MLHHTGFITRPNNPNPIIALRETVRPPKRLDPSRTKFRLYVTAPISRSRLLRIASFPIRGAMLPNNPHAWGGRGGASWVLQAGKVCTSSVQEVYVSV